MSRCWLQISDLAACFAAGVPVIVGGASSLGKVDRPEPLRKAPGTAAFICRR